MLQASEDVALAYLSTVSASGKLLAPTVSGQASQAPVLQLRVCLQSCLAGPSAATSLQVVSYTEGVRERCHSSWLATFMPAALADGGPEQLPDSAACAACSAAHLQSETGAPAVFGSNTCMCGCAFLCTAYGKCLSQCTAEL